MRGEVRTGLLGWCSFLVRETGEVPDHGSASQHSSNLNQSISFLAGWFFFGCCCSCRELAWVISSHSLSLADISHEHFNNLGLLSSVRGAERLRASEERRLLIGWQVTSPGLRRRDADRRVAIGG